MMYEEISLLWRTPQDPYFRLEHKTLEDLNLGAVFHELREDLSEKLMKTLTQVPVGQETVLYRQKIMEDLVKNPGLLEKLKRNMERASAIGNLIKFAFQSEANMYNLLSRMDEVWEVMTITENLQEALAKAHISSTGLKRIEETLHLAINSDTYQDFKEDIRDIRTMDEGVKCIKVGVNLDEYLKPREVILVSMEEEPFKYTRKMKKTGKILRYGLNQIKAIPRKIFAPDSLALPDALNNLERVMAPAMGELIGFCDNFNKSLLSLYEPILKELAFYRIGYQIYEKMTKEHLHCSLPKFHEEGYTRMTSFYNLNLAYDLMSRQKVQEIVTNDFTMDTGNMFILTGANRGGKTTFTQGIGQVYWLGQLGFYVPAKKAEVKLIDGLFTHFPTVEAQTIHNGRLGEECERFSSIFSRMSSKGLLLMNESFDGTSYAESLIIAMDTLKAIGHLGANVIFNTHLHELGKRVAELNSGLTKARAISLVTNLYHEEDAFKVIEGEPEGKSYASDIAKKYGVSYEQLVKM